MAGDSVTTKGPRLPADLRTRGVQEVQAEEQRVDATPQKLEAPPTTRVPVETSGSVQQTRSTGGDAVNVFAVNRAKRGRVRQPRLRVALVKLANAVQTRAMRGFMADVSGDLEAFRRQQA